MPIDYDAIKDSRIVLAGNGESPLQDLQRILTGGEYTEIRTTDDPEALLELCRRFQPDLVVIDLDLAQDRAEDALAHMAQERGSDYRLPSVLGVTEGASHETISRAVEWGVRDVLRKPVDDVEVLLRVRHALEARELEYQLERQSGWLERRAQERDQQHERATLGTLRVLARLVEYRDYKTEQHSERVGQLSARIARELGLPEEDVQLLREAAPLHDVGMVVVPDRILLKEGQLNEEERKILVTHAANGARILSESDLPVMQLAREIAYTHHEHWNGSGYPRGLEKREIPLAGRIVAAADAFEAMTHDRPFRDAGSVEEALEELKDQKEKQFDPHVVNALLALMERERGGL